MRKTILTLLIILIAAFTSAQAQNDVPAQSSPNNENVIYRLFPTSNIYNLIKLDTRNGRMWQVQWNTENDKRFITDLSLLSLVTKEDEKNGRFTLQATQNIYNFLLLDQIDGRVWQVQWSIDPEKRGVIRIY